MVNLGKNAGPARSWLVMFSFSKRINGLFFHKNKR